MKIQEMIDTGERIEQGAWVSDLPNLKDVAVKVRGPFNSDYNALFAKAAKDYSPDEFKTDEVQEKIDIDLVVETILVDWKNVGTDENDDTPFTKEKARELLSDPRLKIFRRAVNWAANNVAHIGRQTLEDATKN